jgi:uncharacterized membrane protein
MQTKPFLRLLLSLLDRFSLERDKDDPQAILSAIERDVSFRGINLWVLIAAVVIASVGLNVNSTAVIIGAMLISPLMGPIVGIGVSLATYNLPLLNNTISHYRLSFWAAASAQRALAAAVRARPPAGRARPSPSSQRKPWPQNGISRCVTSW